jgi:hypothetical protein
LESILKSVLGGGNDSIIDVLGGVLSNGGTLPQEDGIPPEDIDKGRALAVLTALNQVAQTSSSQSNWRYLTAGEKLTLALPNGLLINNIDKVRVYSKRFFGVPPFVTPNGHIYAGESFKADYSVETDTLRSIFVHELMHVYQNRNRFCKIWNGCMIAKGLIPHAWGFVTGRTDELYCYEDHVPPLSSLWQYALEEEAEMVSDRYRLRNSLIEFRGCNRTPTSQGGLDLGALEQLIPF